MNIHYKNYPTDYVDALQGQGKRHKARCFWEYYNDMQNRQANSIGFYAKSWGGDKAMSKGSVHKWVLEFRDQIELFYSAHSLINREHYSSVKKQSERRVNGKRTNEPPQTPTTACFEKIGRTASERQVNKALNINNNTTHARVGSNEDRRWYDSFYFIYRQFNSYAGSKNNAMESYIKIDDVSRRSLDTAAILYLRDHSIDKKVGVKRFLDDKIYLNYLDIKIEVFIEDEWVRGVYDADREVFMAETEVEYAFSATRFAEKLGDCEVNFIREVA